MSLKKASFVLSLRTLMWIVFVMLETAASSPLVTKWTLTSYVTTTDKGICPEMQVSSVMECALKCARLPVCTNFVFGPCDQSLASNQCLCVVCHTPISFTSGGQQVHGVVKVAGIETSKRLVDDHLCEVGDSGAQWSQVSPNCLAAIDSTNTTFSPRPIFVLRLVSVEDLDSGVGKSFTAEPVCHTEFGFVSRGQMVCNSTEGVWHNADSLACLPTTCYQTHLGTDVYAGTLNRDIEGRTCRNWSKPWILINSYMFEEFLFDHNDVKKAKNYCRAWYKDKDPKNWCYNAEHKIGDDRWAYCDINACSSVY